MALFQLYQNNAAGRLASDLTAGAVSLTLQAGNGALFPSPTPGASCFLATLYQFVANQEANHEIVLVTARAGDVLTIQRAQEGTTARAFAAGDPVELRLTAGSLNSMDQAVKAATSFDSARNVTRNPNGSIARIDGTRNGLPFSQVFGRDAQGRIASITETYNGTTLTTTLARDAQGRYSGDTTV